MFAATAIRTEHAQRITLQHHAADMAQALADEQQAHAVTRDAHDNLARLLRQERDTASREYHLQREDAQARVDAAVIRAMAAERDRDAMAERLRQIEAPQ